MCGGGVLYINLLGGYVTWKERTLFGVFISGEEQIYMHRRSTYLLYDMIDFWITVTNFPNPRSKGTVPRERNLQVPKCYLI